MHGAVSVSTVIGVPMQWPPEHVGWEIVRVQVPIVGQGLGSAGSAMHAVHGPVSDVPHGTPSVLIRPQPVVSVVIAPFATHVPPTHELTVDVRLIVPVTSHSLAKVQSVHMLVAGGQSLLVRHPVQVASASTHRRPAAAHGSTPWTLQVPSAHVSSPLQ